MDDKEKLEELKEGVLKPDEKLQKFDDKGLTDDYLIGKLKDQCEAEGEVLRKISKKETVIIKIPLWKIQQDAVKEANKLKGNYPAEKHEHTGDVIFHSNVPEPDMPKEEEEKTPNPETKEEETTFHIADIEEGGTGTGTSTDGPIETTDTEKEPEPPEEFKDHHRSRRESGK